LTLPLHRKFELLLPIVSNLLNNQRRETHFTKL